MKKRPSIVTDLVEHFEDVQLKHHPHGIDTGDENLEPPEDEPEEDA